MTERDFILSRLSPSELVIARDLGLRLTPLQLQRAAQWERERAERDEAEAWERLRRREETRKSA